VAGRMRNSKNGSKNGCDAVAALPEMDIYALMSTAHDDVDVSGPVNYELRPRGSYSDTMHASMAAVASTATLDTETDPVYALMTTMDDHLDPAGAVSYHSGAPTPHSISRSRTLEAANLAVASSAPGERDHVYTHMAVLDDNVDASGAVSYQTVPRRSLVSTSTMAAVVSSLADQSLKQSRRASAHTEADTSAVIAGIPENVDSSGSIVFRAPARSTPSKIMAAVASIATLDAEHDPVYALMATKDDHVDPSGAVRYHADTPAPHCLSRSRTLEGAKLVVASPLAGEHDQVDTHIAMHDNVDAQGAVSYAPVLQSLSGSAASMAFVASSSADQAQKESLRDRASIETHVCAVRAEIHDRFDPSGSTAIDAPMQRESSSILDASMATVDSVSHIKSEHDHVYTHKAAMDDTIDSTGAVSYCLVPHTMSGSVASMAVVVSALAPPRTDVKHDQVQEESSRASSAAETEFTRAELEAANAHCAQVKQDEMHGKRLRELRERTPSHDKPSSSTWFGQWLSAACCSSGFRQSDHQEGCGRR